MAAVSGENHLLPPEPPRLSDISAAAIHRVLFDASPDAMVVANEHGRLLDVNPSALDFLGYERDAFLALQETDVITPGHQSDLDSSGAVVVSTREAVVRTSSGTRLQVDARTYACRLQDENLFITILREPTERKEAEEARSWLSAIFESSVDAVVGESLDGHITSWNPAAEQLYGYSAEEVIGTEPSRLAPPERWQELDELMARCRTGLSFRDFETERITRDGRKIDVSISAFPVKNDAGELIATSAIVRDITARKATESELVASEQRFRTAFEDAPVGIMLIDVEGRILDVNRATCAILGYEKPDLVGSNSFSIIYPSDASAGHSLVQHALANDIHPGSREMRLVHANGDARWVQLSASRIRDHSGSPDYFIVQLLDVSATKEAADELAAIHLRTGDILERINDGFVALDPEWRLTYVNQAALRLLGRDRDELLEQDFWTAFGAELRPSLWEPFHEALSSSTFTSSEVFFPLQDAWFTVRAYPTAEGLAVFFRDVTESRQLALELRASEAKFRRLVEQIPAVVYIVAADDNLTPQYYSPYLLEMTGVTPEEAIAQISQDHWAVDVHPDDRDRVGGDDEFDPATGRPVPVEYRIRRKDGSYVWVRDEYLPVRDDSGTILAWQGVLIDISDRIRAEEAQARLAAIVEGAEDAIYSRTLDGAITSWNHGAERLYGYSANEAIGQQFTMLLPRQEMTNPLLANEDLERSPARFEAVRVRKDGETLEASISLSPLHDRHGVLVGVSAITRDITERKRTEEALRSALEEAEAGRRAKTLFLAMMSHELRTPLQAILGYADLLLRDAPQTFASEQIEDIGYIRRGAERMVLLIDQMLDLSRMEAGRLDLATELVNIHEIVEEVRQDIAPQAAAKNLEIVISLPSQLPQAIGDASRIRQILLNLAGNAVKFTNEGSVRIFARPGRDSIDVTVADTGIGIATADLPRVFEEFRQVDSRLSRRHGGAGLGLAVSSKLAEQMGGVITVASQPGVGSRFTLRLPRNANA